MLAYQINLTVVLWCCGVVRGEKREERREKREEARYERGESEERAIANMQSPPFRTTTTTKTTTKNILATLQTIINHSFNVLQVQVFPVT